MDAYLKTTESADMPENTATTPIAGYNSKRCEAFLTDDSELFQKPIFKLAVETMQNRKKFGYNLAEVMAMMNVHNQICSACRFKEGPLFTCSCCGILQVCSKECHEIIKTELRDHKTTTQRF